MVNTSSMKNTTSMMNCRESSLLSAKHADLLSLHSTTHPPNVKMMTQTVTMRLMTQIQVTMLIPKMIMPFTPLVTALTKGTRVIKMTQKQGMVKMTRWLMMGTPKVLLPHTLPVTTQIITLTPLTTCKTLFSLSTNSYMELTTSHI